MYPDNSAAQRDIEAFGCASGNEADLRRQGAMANANTARAIERWLESDSALDDQRVVKPSAHSFVSRCGRLRVLPKLGLVALLGLPCLSHALPLANATSKISLNCGSQISLSLVGEASEDCMVEASVRGSPASGSVITMLGDRPTATATAMNVGEFLKFKYGVNVSANLTYEVRVVELATPSASVSLVPVTVSVRGEVKRDTLLDNSTTAPFAYGRAQVTLRRSGDSIFDYDDLLNEVAVRSPSKPLEDTPDFDKTVALSLVPGHTYFVTLFASCRLWPASNGSVETVSSRSTCSAEADPVFALDQAALDKQLGESSFSLAGHYGFEYSTGVSSTIPEAGTAGLLLFGLAGLIARSRGFRSRDATGYAA